MEILGIKSALGCILDIKAQALKRFRSGIANQDWNKMKKCQRRRGLLSERLRPVDLYTGLMWNTPRILHQYQRCVTTASSDEAIVVLSGGLYRIPPKSKGRLFWGCGAKGGLCIEYTRHTRRQRVYLETLPVLSCVEFVRFVGLFGAKCPGEPFGKCLLFSKADQLIVIWAGGWMAFFTTF